jgi:excisionase family DNA binding protein
MPVAIRSRIEPRLPTERESALARSAALQLAGQFPEGETAKLLVLSPEKPNEPLELPAEALRLLLDALARMGEGAAVTLTPVHPELTTQEAADLLNVSRPYLIKLLDAGEIPFRKIGMHRRIPTQQLLNYREKVRAASDKALDDLVAEAQELGLGY